MEKTLSNIRENLNDYRNNLSYPTQSIIPERYILTDKNPVYDENLSIKEIRQKTKEYNELIKLKKQEYHNEENRLNDLFSSDIKSALINEYNFNEKQAAKIFSEAYLKGHSGGYTDVLVETEILAEFVHSILTI